MCPAPSQQGHPKFTGFAGVGEVIRLTSSQVPQPTSPTHSSEVPGRKVNRNGLRSP
jgi:hypothetical protein